MKTKDVLCAFLVLISLVEHTSSEAIELSHETSTFEIVRQEFNRTNKDKECQLFLLKRTRFQNSENLRLKFTSINWTNFFVAKQFVKWEDANNGNPDPRLDRLGDNGIVFMSNQEFIVEFHLTFNGEDKDIWICPSDYDPISKLLIQFEVQCKLVWLSFR
jgi:hypothetical protein